MITKFPVAVVESAIQKQNNITEKQDESVIKLVIGLFNKWDGVINSINDGAKVAVLKFCTSCIALFCVSSSYKASKNWK